MKVQIGKWDGVLLTGEKEGNTERKGGMRDKNVWKSHKGNFY